MTAPGPGPYNRLAEFLATRDSWLRLVVVPGRHGGWDVVLRVDGAYSDRRDAEAIRDFLVEVLAEEYDVDLDVLRDRAHGRRSR